MAIGQRKSTVAQLATVLEEADALKNTIIVMAAADEAAPIKFLAPYAGCAMAEHFLYGGRAALTIYDDLTKHAFAYRQMSLLLRRPPGREAYPGDVFYLHSRLLERAVKLADHIVDPLTGEGARWRVADLSAGDRNPGGGRFGLHPDNVISITDGRIHLEPSLFYAGVRRRSTSAYRSPRSVAMLRSCTDAAEWSRLKLDLSQYRDLEAFSQFGSELDTETQRTLARG